MGNGKIGPYSWRLQEQKERLLTKTMERSEVFSTHEFGVGCSKNKSYTIKTINDKPFRERSCQLAPADVEPLRPHPSEVRYARIITESQSP